MDEKIKVTNKCPFCERSTHKESKYCIFHAGAEEKTEEEFKNALKEYIREIKEGDEDYNFKRFIFVGNINFKKVFGVDIFKNANFVRAIFKGSVVFENVIFRGVGSELALEHFKNTDIPPIIIAVDFLYAIFEEDVYFDHVSFNGWAVFWSVLLKRTANFQDVIFNDITSFSFCTFKMNAEFSEVTFKESADFKNVNFERDARFSLIGENYIPFKIDFENMTMLPGNNFYIETGLNKCELLLRKIFVENDYLELHLNENVLIDFTDAIIKNTKIKKEQIKNNILQEKRNEFSNAKEIYIILKNNYHSSGRYNEESWAYLKEREMDRLSQSFPYYKKSLKEEDKQEKLPFLKWIRKGNFIKWIISAFSNMIYGYGEKPWNVVIVAGAIIIVFAYFFSLIGIGNPEIIEAQGKIHPIPGTDMRLVSEGVLKNTKIMQFSNCLYFSLITFTTLGYGDFRPLEGWGRILAGSEAFIGAFMMALFVYTFARRTGGR